jgi:hypothetical protein
MELLAFSYPRWSSGALELGKVTSTCREKSPVIYVWTAQLAKKKKNSSYIGHPRRKIFPTLFQFEILHIEEDREGMT